MIVCHSPSRPTPFENSCGERGWTRICVSLFILSLVWLERLLLFVDISSRLNSKSKKDLKLRQEGNFFNGSSTYHLLSNPLIWLSSTFSRYLFIIYFINPSSTYHLLSNPFIWLSSTFSRYLFINYFINPSSTYHLLSNPFIWLSSTFSRYLFIIYFITPSSTYHLLSNPFIYLSSTL